MGTARVPAAEEAVPRPPGPAALHTYLATPPHADPGTVSRARAAAPLGGKVSFVPAPYLDY